MDLIEKNLYFDAILQSIGLISLGEAVRVNVEKLNDPRKFIHETDLYKIKDISQYVWTSRVATSIPIDDLLQNFDKVRDAIGNTITAYIDDINNPRIVAGTMRIYAALKEPTAGAIASEIVFTLTWLTKKEKD